MRNFYRYIIKPILFRLDAELVHNIVTVFGEGLENQAIVEKLLRFESPHLKKNVLGIEFDNPVGLAAGFDYDGHLAKVMRSVGFGFNTVGTVTAGAYEGNQKPRLARLPKSQSLLVNKGFKSEGAEMVAKRLDKKNLMGNTIGLSVGSTNSKRIDSIKKAIDDYLFTFEIFKERSYVKYFELNISCPNTAMTENFVDLKNFNILVRAISGLKIKQPIFVKMPNEIEIHDSTDLIRMALKYNIHGFIFSNLVKNRKNLAFDKEEIMKMADFKGNFSGKPTERNSNLNIVKARKIFGREIAIIGCGGIFSPLDAFSKFDAGADLVQLVTGMIYEGPQLPGEICRALISRSFSRPRK